MEFFQHSEASFSYDIYVPPPMFIERLSKMLAQVEGQIIEDVRDFKYNPDPS